MQLWKVKVKKKGKKEFFDISLEKVLLHELVLQAESIKCLHW